MMLEGFEIERQFIEAGWQTIRYSGGTFKLLVTFPGGLEVSIDVFTAFYLDGMLHMMPFVAANLPRDALVPTSTVMLEGREVAAPAKPEALLEATFGSGWRVPDPTFRHKEPRWLKRRLSGLLRGDRRHQAYWDTFYKTKAGKVPTEPSSFAQWVAEPQRRPTSLIDVGSGTGRDSLWLAAQGISVLGCDYSSAGVEYARTRASEQGVSATFRRLNLYDLRQMLAAGALLDREQRADAVYARFLVHALEDEGRQNLWRFSRSVLAGTRGRLFLEFRTEPTDHAFGEHYRQFVSPQTVSAELEAYGFDIEHCEVGHGLAVHGAEDPQVCRLIATLKG
jgi:SAM-dependent methyltransferase